MSKNRTTAVVYEYSNRQYYELDSDKRFAFEDFPTFLQERLAMLMAVNSFDSFVTYVEGLGVAYRKVDSFTTPPITAFFEVVVTTEEMETLREMQR
jgi:hypothetical protein